VPINEKSFIAGYNQTPDTLFGPESQSSITSQVLVGTGNCIDQLEYEYRATYCFANNDLPTLDTGNAVTETVQVDPNNISPENPIVVEGTVVTDTAAAEAAGVTIPESLDQLRITFNLNPNLFWEDGEPVTAEDAVLMFNTYKNPDLQLASRYTIERIVSAEATNQNTVVYTYAPGYLDSDYYVTFLGFLPSHKYADSELTEIRDTESVDPTSFGPYMVEEHLPGEQTTLVNNPYFFDQPNIGTVIYKYVADSDQLLAQLEGGDVDFAGTIGLTLAQAPRLDELAGQGAIEVQYVPATVWEHLDFGIERLDGQESFFADTRVRQAVAYAIDRQAIINDVLFGKTTVMNTYVPSDHPSYPGDDALEQYEYDPARAQQLLDEAGATDSDGDGVREVNGRPFSLTVYTTEGNATRTATLELIQQDLQEVGIQAELQFVPGAAQLFKNGAEGILAGRRFDMALYAWVSGVDASHLLYLGDQVPTAENGYSGQNNTGFRNEEFDTAARRALTTIDVEAKREADREPLVIYNRELPSFPLFQRANVAAFSPRVSGIQIDPTSFFDLYNIQDIDIADE